MQRYPDATFRDVTAPNADTLYTSAWIDMEISLGARHARHEDRYFLFPMLDGSTNVFQVPGKRTTGTKPRPTHYRDGFERGVAAGIKE